MPQVEQVQAYGFCEETREVHCTTAQPFRFIFLSGSLILVDEGSVQLVSTSLALRLPQAVSTYYDVTLELATTPSPIDAFSGPERESLHLWFLSLSFTSRFVKHVFHRSKRRHLVLPTDKKRDIFCLWNVEGMSFEKSYILLVSVSIPPRLAYKR